MLWTTTLCVCMWYSRILQLEHVKDPWYDVLGLPGAAVQDPVPEGGEQPVQWVADHLEGEVGARVQALQKLVCTFQGHEVCYPEREKREKQLGELLDLQ